MRTTVKYICELVLVVLISLPAAAQQLCGTKTPATPFFPNLERIAQSRINLTYPLPLKISVHVLADGNGSNRAVEDTAVFRQLENMRQLYAAHNICFVFGGIEQINHTNLNYMNTETDRVLLAPYLVSGVMQIFIHSTLVDGDGETLNGICYELPGTRVSIVASAINSMTNISTLSHEIGHALGLYHTFETAFGTELIGRSNDCVNCFIAGDLLCDTPADPHSDSYDTGNFINANCNFFGSPSQYCDGEEIFYDMDPTNVMAYGRRACRNQFTNGQGARMRGILVGTLDHLIALENQTISTNQTISDGRLFFLARNNVTVTASSFVVNSEAKVNFSAGSVTISPGTKFSAGSGGYTVVRANTLCR